MAAFTVERSCDSFSEPVRLTPDEKQTRAFFQRRGEHIHGVFERAELAIRVEEIEPELSAVNAAPVSSSVSSAAAPSSEFASSPSQRFDGGEQNAFFMLEKSCRIMSCEERMTAGGDRLRSSTC